MLDTLRHGRHQSDQFVEPQIEDIPVHLEAAIDRQHGASQRAITERVMLRILFERLEAAREVHDPSRDLSVTQAHCLTCLNGAFASDERPIEQSGVFRETRLGSS